jgi:CubicO group peptidase (beta-lactamase class C family)
MRSSMKSWRQSSILLVLFLIISCSLFSLVAAIKIPGGIQLSNTSSEPDYWPANGWRNSTPGEHGMSAQILNNMMNYIENQDYPIDSVLIIKDGYSVLEEYPGKYNSNITLHAQHSVGKSVVSILLGVAFQQGMLENVSQHVLDFFPEYDYLDFDPGWENITIEHLLTMTPGFDWDEWSYPYVYPGGNPIMNMMHSRDAIEFVLNRSMLYAPGEHWEYNGGASTLLGAIIQQVYDDQLYYVLRDHLFNHLGITYFSLPMLPGGWYNVMGGFRLRTTDMAKLGFLYLNNGTWNGTQIVPADYVASSIRPIEHENPLGPSFGYGWHWWLRSDLGIYFAYGRYGQKIMVSEEHNMIVVFTASIGDDEYDPEFDLYGNYILQSAMAGPDGGNAPGLSPEVLIGAAIVGIVSVPIVAVFVKWVRKN